MSTHRMQHSENASCPQRLRSLSAIGLLAFACMMGTPQSAAAWSTVASTNDPICSAGGEQDTARITFDGAGGVIITWTDGRGDDDDIYAQRMNLPGARQWANNGVPVCAAGSEQGSQQIVSDGAGGAIIVWEDLRSELTTDIYAQRINAAGVRQWGNDGIVICTATNDQFNPQLASDGAGGAIIVWEDQRAATDNDNIYAQRVNAAGLVLWAANGVPVCVAASVQNSPQLVADGAGGAVISWDDRRNGLNSDIYVQRLNSAGLPQWTLDGVGICIASDQQYNPQLVTDGASGAVIAWQDRRNGVDFDIYTQRVNASGTELWTTSGVALCSAANEQFFPHLATDLLGGAFVTWLDRRGGTNYDVYAQRISGGGTPQWNPNGNVISTAFNSTFSEIVPQIVPDGAAGCILTWDDERNGATDVFAQRLNPAGANQWTTGGLAISTAAGSQSFAHLVADGTGGAFIAWEDTRATVSDIYASYVLPVGALGSGGSGGGGGGGGVNGVDLTGTWLPLFPSVCKTSTKGTQCKFKASLALTNGGNADSGPFVVKFYASADGVLSGDDVFLKLWKVKKLKAGYARTKKVNGKLPLNVQSAGMTVFAVIDADALVTEANESNNVPGALVP